MKYYYTFRLVFYTVLSVLIGVYSHQLLEYLPYLVGAVMCLFGIDSILIPVAKQPTKFYQNYQFFLGHVELLLGIVVIAAIPYFDYVCVIWATWTIVRESFDLYEVAHKVWHRFPAVLSLILSVIEIVFSVLLLIYATEHHALTHIYLLIPEFIINALSPILFKVHTKHKAKKDKPKEEENK